MNKFEYTTFHLAEFKTPALRYRQMKFDAQHTGNIPEFEFLPVLIKEMENKYSEDELTVTDEDERQYWINKLGRQAALELVTTNRCTSETMGQLECLEEEDFTAAVMLSNRMAKELQAQIQKAESMAPTHL